MISANEAQEILFSVVDKTLDCIYKQIEEAARSGKTFITVPQDNLSRLQRRRLLSLDYHLESKTDEYDIVF